ncbi:hypothetical protein D3C87_2060920 [compost metagenome]
MSSGASGRGAKRSSGMALISTSKNWIKLAMAVLSVRMRSLRALCCSSSVLAEKSRVA